MFPSKNKIWQSLGLNVESAKYVTGAALLCVRVRNIINCFEKCSSTSDL